MIRPVLSIVIPVRNDEVRLRRCLAAITANHLADAAEIIVADNGSSDGSADVAHAAGATVLSVPDMTVANVRNVASDQASGELLAFVDADHLIDERWVESAVAIFQDATVGGAGAPYSSPPDANWVQRTYALFRPTVQRRQDTEWLGSGNLVVRRSAFKAVGGFDPALEACEDVELCGRLRRAGCRLVVDPRLRSVHLGDPRTLRALFLGELWRGRNNIRVTFRGPLTLGALPSVVIPIINLVCMAAAIAVIWFDVRVAVAAVAVVAAFVLVRAIRMMRRNPRRGVVEIMRSVLVAGVYETARAVSLVMRATHRTRRELAGERAVA